MSKKLLVIDVAALGWNMASKLPGFQSTQTVFPAVTCTAQASFRTAAAPAEHGMVANGLYYPTLRKVLFWEQSSALVQGRRIWEDFRTRGKKVGLMFWQQAMGEDADLIVTPAPIHKHSGGMIQSCYTLPEGLEDRLSDAVGRRFNLMNYWGPLANHKSSDWIVDSIIAVLGMPDVAPDLLLTYIPHLDYDLQRYGPESPQAQKALDVLEGYLTRLKKAAEQHGYDWLIFGDYAIEPVRRGAIFPNIALREAGLLATRDIRGMAYAVIGSSRAFAMVDHQVAHVICKDEASAQEARKVLEALPGVSKVLDRAEQAAYGLDHPNSGDLVVMAEDGAWFAYPWFSDKSEAPDYASHVDIHNKPGFDPCELFFGWPPGTVSMNTQKIRGSHGNVGTGFEIGWSSSLSFPTAPASLLDLARFTEEWMKNQS